MTSSNTPNIFTPLTDTPLIQPLLIELFVEELPPKSLNILGESFAHSIYTGLIVQGLCDASAIKTVFASPRRLGVLIDAVASCGTEKKVLQKLMPITVGLDATGAASPALLKKLTALGAANIPVTALKNQAGILFLDSTIQGTQLTVAVQQALTDALLKLPIAKTMQYQLSNNCDVPGWSTVSFVRPAHGLMVLHGETVLPITALGLIAGRTTQGHRFEALDALITLNHANDYENLLETRGAVIPNFNKRRAMIVAQLAAQSSALGNVHPIEDAALLDEVTALVEQPNILPCTFDSEFLAIPQECLILTMKANQKYFPLLDEKQALTHHFLVVSNISPIDTSQVITGNERVIRPRLSDAKFFFDQDRKKTLYSRIVQLNTVIYHNQLGTQGERTVRVASIARNIAIALDPTDDTLAIQSHHAATLAKTDLLTDMVGEFPELQGTMGRYYALNDGENSIIADAIEDHYKPKFAGDTLPRNKVGVVVALADKLETLVGLFGIGALPTGDKDPFALRRHALGVIRLLAENALPLNLKDLIVQTADVFTTGLLTHSLAPLETFIYDRLSGQLREQGYSIQTIEAVLNNRPTVLHDINARLAAVKIFADLPEAPALAAANKRIYHILKKINPDSHSTNPVNSVNPLIAAVDPALLFEAAEKQLYEALKVVVIKAQAAFIAKQYTENLQILAVLKPSVDAFFETVMVNVDDDILRLNRQTLLAHLHYAMNQVADLSKLAA
jgi:glycyl-tRNA synthetase beta chain